MTTGIIHKDVSHDNFTESLNQIFTSYLKKINTGLPGIIDKFDKETRRAKVQVALKVLLDDGTEISRSPIIDVPVLFPGTGSYMLWFDLQKGDTVWLKFSQTGMTKFKETYEVSQPDIAARFREMDAVAEAGFGPLEMTPARNVGVSLQHVSEPWHVSINDDEVIMRRGDTHVRMTDSGIEFKHGSQVMTLGSGGFNAQTGSFTHRGTNVGDSHTHPYSWTDPGGSSNTGGPG